MDMDDALKDGLANLLERVDRLSLRECVGDLAALRTARDVFENEVTRCFGSDENLTGIEVFNARLKGQEI